MTPAQARRADLAKKLIGMKHEDATKAIAESHNSYRFIVMEGMPCGRNTDVSRTTFCLFSDSNNVIEEAVVGTQGIYKHPRYANACNPK